MIARRFRCGDPGTMRELIVHIAQAIADKPEDVQVFIKPTANVPYAQVIRVYASAMKAGAVKIGFQTAAG